VSETTTVPRDTYTTFAKDTLVAAGCDPEEAAVSADVLVWNDAAGRGGHGMIRLPILCKRLKAGLFRSPCEPSIAEKGPALAHIDGHNGIGPYLGQVAVDEAVARAKRQGSAVVSVTNGNFSGTGAYFVHRLAEQGCLGLALSNSFPKVAAAGGRSAVLGTNPFAFGAPRGDGTNVLVDFATSAMAGATVRKLAEAGEPLPEGSVVGPDGRWIRDPADADKGALTPMAGAKGFALSLTVEILCGVLSGAGISHGAKSMFKDMENPANLGHFFLAVDIGRIMPLEQFGERMEHLAGILYADEGVRLPGDSRWKALRESEARGGVAVGGSLRAKLDELAAGLDVATPW